jgi:hypothetical protein
MQLGPPGGTEVRPPAQPDPHDYGVVNSHPLPRLDLDIDKF